MTQAKPTTIKFSKRYPVEPYGGEEFSVELFCDENCTETIEEVFARARMSVHKSSLAYIKAMQEKKQKEGTK